MERLLADADKKLVLNQQLEVTQVTPDTTKNPILCSKTQSTWTTPSWKLSEKQKLSSTRAHPYYVEIQAPLTAEAISFMGRQVPARAVSRLLYHPI
jgi:hypothetical protein